MALREAKQPRWREGGEAREVFLDEEGQWKAQGNQVIALEEADFEGVLSGCVHKQDCEDVQWVGE